MTPELKFPTDAEYPEGFNWFAYDESGGGCFYKVEPIMKSGYWLPSSEKVSDWESAYLLDLHRFVSDETVTNWKETLRKKGESPTTNKPNYYTWHPAIECLKVSQQFSSNLGQSIQYIWRSETLNTKAITKGKTTAEIIDDLEKARNFIGYEIERIKNETTA